MVKQGGKRRGNGHSRGGGQASTSQENRQQKPSASRQRQGEDKAGPSTLTEEQVWVDNAEASTRAKNLRGQNRLTLVQRIHLN